MRLETSANVVEVELDGRKYTKVNYTKCEEIANCITHGIGALIYIALMIYMLTLSFDARSVATSLITCLSAILVYTVSTIYHAVQDTKKKFFWRKADHSGIPFLVIGCSSSVCLLLSTHIYNYVALGVCLSLAVISMAMSIKSVDKFKTFTMIINFAIGIIMFASFIINRNFILTEVKYLYLAGAILCITGSILFAFKVRYVHSIFHVCILAGTLFFFTASLLILQNYNGF